MKFHGAAVCNLKYKGSIMATNKEILNKLLKIAENQQKILTKLAQAAEPLTESPDPEVFRDEIQGTLKVAFDNAGMKTGTITAALTANNSVANTFDISIQAQGAPTGRAACSIAKNICTKVLARHSVKAGVVTLNGQVC
jgi:hypothetical protein